MSELMMQCPGVVSDARGTFQARAMGRERADGSWEGWLEFVSASDDTATVHVTPIETHQHDRVTMQRWASGLTRVYAEGALARTRTQPAAPASSQLLATLQELVEALDRRIPHVERNGEVQIAADANRLRASAVQRIALLRESRDRGLEAVATSGAVRAK